MYEFLNLLNNKKFRELAVTFNTAGGLERSVPTQTTDGAVGTTVRRIIDQTVKVTSGFFVTPLKKSA